MQLHRWIKKFSKFSFMMCGVQQLCISPLGAQFTKMAANGSEKAFCVFTFHECLPVTIVQRQFRTKFGKQPASDNSIRRWYTQFQERGCVYKRKSTGRPSVTEEQVEQFRQAFVRSPRKSTVRGSRQIGTPHPTVWRILRKRPKLKPYRPVSTDTSENF